MCNKLAKVDFEQWNGFKGDRWKEKIDVRNFISMNYELLLLNKKTVSFNRKIIIIIFNKE